MRNPRDLWTGIIFAGIGGAAVVIARDYPMGTATRMGPAYFPALVGAVLALLGVISIVRAFLQPGEPLRGFAWKPAVLVLASTVLFGVMVRRLGLGPAVVVLVLVSAVASTMFRWAPALALAVGLAIFSILVFVKGLGLPLAAFGGW